MKYNDMFEIIKKLRFDEKVFLCKDSEGVEIYVYRPSKLNKKLKNVYDVNKNFQIWLKEEQREFRPNHLRLMIDLNLRTRSKTQLKRELLTIFDNIYYGADPNEEIKLLKTEKFNHYLNSLQIISNLAQLFLIEQDYNYNKESKFEPKTLFFQGWIREFIDSPKEIDNMCMSVCNGQPPKIQYTDKENKKHKKYQEDLVPLWYLK
ncbi:hypothetical protein J4418_02180 [Candidatus Woesearchaeota archaeon]|nr:hypothetical protein [Candidatus Woesearchaeota archaeon]